MIRGVAAGILSFILMGAVLLAIVAPFVYNVFSGLFPAGDSTGIVVGLVAVLLVGYVFTQLAILLSVGIGALIGVLLDR